MAPSPSLRALEALQLVVEEADVEGGVVGHDHRSLEELEQLGDHLLDAGGIGHHLLGDAGYLGDHRRDGPHGVHQGGEVPDLPEALDAHGSDLGDLAGARPGAGGLQVESDEGHVGQVGVGDSQVRSESSPVSGLVPVEAPVLADEGVRISRQSGPGTASEAMRRRAASTASRGSPRTSRVSWSWSATLSESCNCIGGGLDLGSKRASLKRPSSSWTILAPWTRGQAAVAGEGRSAGPN